MSRCLCGGYVRSCFFVLGSLFVLASPAFAQLDPLLFLKNQQPNVVLVVETTNRMQRDADLTYYDPGEYNTGSWFATLGLPSALGKHRRKFLNLEHITPGNSSEPKFTATHVSTLADSNSDYSTFYERTRLVIARRSLVQAINDNMTSVRFSLIKTRQTNPSVPSNSGNETSIVTDITQQAPTDSSTGKWKLTRTTVGTGNNPPSDTATAAQGPLVKPEDNNATSTILNKLNADFWANGTGALIPAGGDKKDVIDAPVSTMMDDARTEAARLIAADTSGCRNTVVVLVVGGGEGTITPQNLHTKAQTFLNVSGRRVPIYVIAIAPESTYVSSLQDIATTTGGEYFEISKTLIEATTLGQPVPEAVRGVNRAIQHTFASFTDFNTAPTSSLPVGPKTEFQVTSPIVGSVNLKGAQYYRPDTGALSTLPDSETEIYHATTGAIIPQRSNVLVTAGFALPGFEGRLRAMRVYKPVHDSTRPSGYKFTQDGSRLWVASTPAAANRNIYTILPNTNTPIKFETSNAATLSPYLRVNDASTLIDWIRNRPLGAVIGSTPAFLDPPSLDPPPDADYPGFLEANKDRRTLIFVGANDGMLHALDARTGTEVWAFIPFNLLPKLRALRSGQSLDAFKYFVESSAKIADVKVGDAWRTYLFIGQGPGGTFYNALDVTLDEMAGAVSDTADVSALLTYFATADRITRKWSFPRNSSFDATLGAYGDVAASASATEKTVGETWSDPAVGQLVNEDGPYVMLVGSGFLKYSVEQAANRGGTAAGRNFYVIDAATGDLRATKQVPADNKAESVDDCRTAAQGCMNLKNALQMDPVATGASDSRFVSKVYIGDLDGIVWRFDLSLTSGGAPSLADPVKLYDTRQPLFASMATVSVGGTKQYLFVATGSDLLPSTSVNDVYELLVLLDNGNSGSKTAGIPLERTDNSGVDEKVTAFPAVAGDIVFFTTNSISPAQVCSPFTANLYAFTFIGGPAYDTNNDGRLTASGTNADTAKVMSVAGVRATAPFIVDQHLSFAAGNKIELFGDPDDFNNGVGQAGVRILSWRLVK